MYILVKSTRNIKQIFISYMAFITNLTRVINRHRIHVDGDARIPALQSNRNCITCHTIPLINEN